MSFYHFNPLHTQSSNGPKGFIPYTDNGGLVVGVAGEDYAVIASDTRLANSFHILSRHQQKTFKLNDKAAIGLTGCFADATSLVKFVKTNMSIYEQDHHKPMSIAALAQMLQVMLYFKRFFPYYVSTVLVGLDGEGQGWVYNYDPVGSYERCKCYAAGSGASQPLLDNQVLKTNMKGASEEPMPMKTAISLIKDVFTSAAERQIHVGDCVKIMIITKHGVTKESFELRKD